MKNALFLILVSALFFGCGGSSNGSGGIGGVTISTTPANDHSAEKEQIKAHITELENKKADLNASIDKLNAAISVQKDKRGDAEGFHLLRSKDKKESDIGAVDAEILRLEGEKANTEAELTKTQNAISSETEKLNQL